jgi:hypothetical protein
MKNKGIYSKISGLLYAIQNCEQTNNTEWLTKHQDSIQKLCKDLPSGSGIDNGTKIDMYLSKPEKLVFDVGFHHMDDNGSYDGWTEHKVIVTPSLAWGFEVRITGKDRNDIKSYLHDVYATVDND